MKIDARIAFAAITLLAAACSGMSGLDSGTGGMPGEVGPPVNSQGALGQQQGVNGGATNTGGPTAGPNGIAELTNPGSTLAPNQAQYPVGDGPTGMKCPLQTLQGQVYSCIFSFNVPSTPAPDSAATGKPKASPSPTPTASPTPEPSDSSDDSDSTDTPTPSPTPPGTITMQVEALPADVPAMTNGDPRALKIAPVVGIRLQSDSDFVLSGTSNATYTIPKTQFVNRLFALQLYNESFARAQASAASVHGGAGATSKRVDTFIAGYAKAVLNPDTSTVTFTFATPKITVKRGQIWLIALYGLTYPPNNTPTPSPAPSPSASASAAPSPSAGPTVSPSPHGT